MSQKKYKVKGGIRWMYVITRRENGERLKDIAEAKFRTKTEAKKGEWERRETLKKEKLMLESGALHVPTIDELFEKSIANRRAGGTKEQTINNYIRNYNKWFKKPIGNTLVTDLEKSFLQKLFDDLTSKLMSVNQLKIFLKGVIQLAVDDDVIFKNPVNGVIIKKNLMKVDVLSRDEHVPLENVAIYYKNLTHFLENRDGGIPERDILLYHLLFLSGIRIGEAMGLRWKDIDLKKRLIDINKTQIQLNGEYVEGEMPKNKDSLRIIPVTNDKLFELLLNWKEKQKLLIEKGSRPLSQDLENLIFFDVGAGKRFRTTYYSNLLDIFYKKNPQNKNITCHALRHTFITIVRNAGCDKEKVGTYVGHNQVNTITDLYTHYATPANLLEVAETADKLIGELLN